MFSRLFFVFFLTRVLAVSETANAASDSKSHASNASPCLIALTSDTASGIADRAIWMNQESAFVGLRGHKEGDRNELADNDLIFTSAKTGDIVLQWPATEWLRPHVSSLKHIYPVFERVDLGDGFVRIRVIDNSRVVNLVAWPDRRLVINLTERAEVYGKLVLSKLHADFRKTQKDLPKDERRKSPWKKDVAALYAVSAKQELAIVSAVFKTQVPRQEHFFIESLLSNRRSGARNKSLPLANWVDTLRGRTVKKAGFLFDDQLVYLLYSDGEVEFRNVADGKVSGEFSSLRAPDPTSGGPESEKIFPTHLDTSWFSVAGDFDAPVILLGRQTKITVERFVGYRFIPKKGWSFFEFPWPRTTGSDRTKPGGIVFDSTGLYLLIDRSTYWPNSSAIGIVDMRPEADSAGEIISVLQPRWIQGLLLPERVGAVYVSSADRRAVEPTAGTLLVQRPSTEEEALQSRVAPWERNPIVPSPGFAARFSYLDLATGKVRPVPSTIAQDGSADVNVVGGAQPHEYYFLSNNQIERIR